MAKRDDHKGDICMIARIDENNRDYTGEDELPEEKMDEKEAFAFTYEAIYGRGGENRHEEESSDVAPPLRNDGIRFIFQIVN